VRFCTETLGCKVNQFETQALETILKARGHVLAEPGSGCQAVIVNTCAVTSESGRKSRQAVRRLKALEPDAVIAVCGCFSQVSPEETAALGAELVCGSGDRLSFIDVLEHICAEKTKKDDGEQLPLGSGNRIGFADELERVAAARTAVRLIDDPHQRRIFEELPAGSVSGRTRAYLKIEDGCQNYCAYCVIPYARGPVRSLPTARVRAEAARLEEEGYGEIVVTGIEISSYGKDLDGGVTLIDAVEAVSAAAPRARLRLGSLEPGTVTEPFIERLSRLHNICGHFHLSLQSGCDATLRRMKRKYTTEEFYDAVRLLRRYFPGCGLTADLIVGFPGETADEFEATLAFIGTCAFSAMHVFPFSTRPGTPAASMPGQLDKAVKRERARRATAAARDMARDYGKSCVGQTLDVLFEREEGGVSDGHIVSIGHADNYLEVAAAGTGLRNTRRQVRIMHEKSGLLFGEIVETTI
jgi:threonylcarbamoyladenosine tRNA methylthiotransferase MtaB